MRVDLAVPSFLDFSEMPIVHGVCWNIVPHRAVTENAVFGRLGFSKTTLDTSVKFVRQLDGLFFRNASLL